MAITTSQWSHVLTIPESYTPSAATSGQTLVITESVIAKLSAADQTTFWSNVQNGGGDVRICTDSGGVNQLPVEVISLDNSAQTCVIWTRKPTYDGLGDLYLFVGKAGETQPPVTDPFGRNAVWVDYEAVLHLSENISNGEYLDSTGNGHNTSIISGSSLLVTQEGNPFGLFWPYFKQFEALALDNSAQILNGGAMHISAWFESYSVSDSKGLIGNRYNTGDREWFQITAGGRSFVKGQTTEDLAENPFNGGVRYLSAGHDSDSLDLFNNGVLVNQDNSIANPSGISSPVGNDYRIGTYFDNISGRRYDGKVGEIRLGRYKPRAEKVATEYANQSDPATFFGTPALATTGGVVSYTITLDSGNYTLVGEQLNLLSDRTLSLQNGGYSLSGVELNLSAQRAISLSEGVYTKQGTDAGFILDRFLSLDTGSYSYIGTDLNLQYGREFRLILEQGSYSLQGAEIGVLRDYVLPMDSSNYTYTSDNVSLLANRRITTDAGDYSYTGSNVNFVYEALGLVYTLSLDSGAYNLTGDSLKLLVNRILPIDFGHYVYEGVGSKLLYNRAIALDSGLYSSSGTNLGVKVNRRLVFQDGNYSLQGTPVTLSYTGEVLAILEGYNLTYKKHPVQSKYKTYNITARYN